ncbi:MAG: helix-turn-helix domain-containing protein [Candidatus Limnocylindrales bacterium]
MADRKRRTSLEVDSLRLLATLLAREGAKVRAARRRRRWTQRETGRRAGLSQPAISQLERGDGATMSLGAWQRVALVLGLPLDLKLGRDMLEEPSDAGHLAMQELVLRASRAIGLERRFELNVKPSDPTRWSDIGIIDRVHRRLLLLECVNVFGDIGASVRSSDRKKAEAEARAVSLGGGGPFAVHVCWVVRDTRRNRDLLARYPEIFRIRFPGSLHAWVDALTTGAPPPVERGLIWADLGATRLFARRRTNSALSCGRQAPLSSPDDQRT